MQIRQKILSNPPLLVLIGCLLGGLFVGILASDASFELRQFGTYGLAALVTLFAAGIAYAATMHGFEHQRRRNQKEDEDGALAARAMLPLAIAEIFERSEKVFCLLKSDQRVADPKRTYDEVKKTVSVSERTLHALEKAIAVSDGTAREWLILIPALWQIAMARIDDEFDPDIIRLGHGNSMNWLVIKAVAANLFQYSRTAHPPPSEISRDKMSVPWACKNLYLDEDFKADIDNYIEKRGGLTLSSLKKNFF